MIRKSTHQPNEAKPDLSEGVEPVRFSANIVDVRDPNNRTSLGSFEHPIDHQKTDGLNNVARLSFGTSRLYLSLFDPHSWRYDNSLKFVKPV